MGANIDMQHMCSTIIIIRSAGKHVRSAYDTNAPVCDCIYAVFGIRFRGAASRQNDGSSHGTVQQDPCANATRQTAKLCSELCGN